MKTQSKFAQVFVFVAAVTVLSWALAFGSAVVAGDQPFPSATLARVDKGLNQTKPIDQTKQAGLVKIQQLNIEGGSVDVNFVPSDTGEVVAHLTGDASKDTQLEFNEVDGALTIKVENKKHVRWALGNNLRPLQLVITLPKSYRRDLAVKLGSGDLAAGKLEVGKLEIKVGSGDIKIGEVNATSLEAKAGSGDIFIGDLLSKEAEARAGSGDVTIKLKEPKSWTAAASAGSGEIESNLPGVELNERKDRLTFGHGDSRLSVKTGSGNIKILL